MTYFIQFFQSFIILIYWLLIVTTTLIIVFRRRPTTYVVAWLLIIYILPVVGIFLYFTVGEANLGKKRATRAQKMQPLINQIRPQLVDFPTIFKTDIQSVSRPIFQLCKHQTGIDGIHNNQIELLSETDSIFDRLITDIDKSKFNIDLVFYIWNQGGRADEVETALIRAAQRGVVCRVMLDSAGSRQFFKAEADQQMREAGITVVESLQVNVLRFMFRRLDLRQHRKVVIIDNMISYTGSMNIVDPRYFKQNKHVGKWVDVMVRMNGPISILMSSIYASDWELETGERLSRTQFPNFSNKMQEKNNVTQLIASGPGYAENMIHQVLLMAIYAAQQSIILTTPYLVPSEDIFNALCTAAQRGIDVSIIIPKKNDSLMVEWASRAFFTELLDKGVKLYQFKDNLLHTKSVLIDNQLSLVGTVNLDMRSLWLNFEITTVIDDTEFANSLNTLLQTYLQHSEEMDASIWNKRPFWQRISERIFYFFAPLL